jgi:heme-degrading monooxygenase HmoA
MIVRAWRGRARAESAEVYQTHVTTSVFPRLRQIDGFIGGRVLRRTVDAQVEFLVETEWASLDAIRAFAGDSPDLAVVEPEARAVLAEFDRRVEHFEVAFEAKP